jgi:acetate---CoA ligase (ADP-forming) subunit beta
MLKAAIRNALDSAAEFGWVLEPDAKGLLRAAGLKVPVFKVCREADEAGAWAREIGYPVAAKVVSAKAMHKSEVKGVVVGISDDKALCEAYDRFRRIDGFTGMLVETMASGVEVIVGAKKDYQFGTIILLGIGGTAVEIYRDTSIRMAPLTERDVRGMVGSLKARALLEGYRGSEVVNIAALVDMMLAFSDLAMTLGERFESIDLNPVMCSGQDCIIADARIVLAGT